MTLLVSLFVASGDELYIGSRLDKNNHKYHRILHALHGVGKRSRERFDVSTLDIPYPVSPKPYITKLTGSKSEVHETSEKTKNGAVAVDLSTPKLGIYSLHHSL